ncbi:MAG: acyl-protein synthetase [Clostridium sp.]
MLDYSGFFSDNPYSLSKEKKSIALYTKFKELTQIHYERCIEYKKIIDTLGVNIDRVSEINNIPFIPVSVFKELELSSIDKSDIIKTMTSSGTSGQRVSKIYLDKSTSISQTKALSKIVSSFIGKKRMPMIIIDCNNVLKDRQMFSARGAGILGFQMFSTERIYALDENMNLLINDIVGFLEKHKGKPIFLFGFTFMIWKHFYMELIRRDLELDLSNAILIHGGGWKKMQDESVSKDYFKNELNRICGIKRVYDYYGMVEQTGSVYLECEYGNMHCSEFSDIIIRDYKDFSVKDIGQEGIIQLLSILPLSYPGHSILTEDRGVIIGEDDCKCGRLGKYFNILGRIKNAEIRGCSDTYESKR